MKKQMGTIHMRIPQLMLVICWYTRHAKINGVRCMHPSPSYVGYLLVDKGKDRWGTMHLPIPQLMWLTFE